MKLWLDERGDWPGWLTVLLVSVLGGTAILFGVLGAQRGLAAREIRAIACLDPTNPDPNCTP